MRRLLAACFVLLLSVLLAGSFLSAKDKLEGKNLYQEYCRGCHGADSPNGEYSPLSLIIDQWEEFFSETLVSTHEGLTDPKHGDQKVLELLTPDHLKSIKAWAVDHAADSEQPMSCDITQ